MCVILYLKPGVEFDFNKLKSACMVNSDGWGTLVKDRGQITMRKEWNGKPNDPDVVQKILEDAKDQERFVHLRFATVGEKSTENCHPFNLATTEDGTTYWLMHNGTFGHGFNEKNEKSDTLSFVNRIASPLVTRTLAAGIEDPLHDEFVQKVLTEFSSGSKLLLADSKEGSKPMTFGAGWHVEEKEGWAASNTYSFQSSYRDSAWDYKNSRWNTSTKGGEAAKENFTMDQGTTGGMTPTTGNVTSIGTQQRTATGRSAIQTECSIDNRPKKAELLPLSDLSERVALYSADTQQDVLDLLGIDSYEDLFSYSVRDIAELAKLFPDTLALLVASLLEEREELVEDNESLRDQLATLEGEGEEGSDLPFAQDNREVVNA